MYGVLMVYIKECHSNLWGFFIRYRHLLLFPYFLFIFLSYYVWPFWFMSSAVGQTLVFPIISLCCALFLPYMDNLRCETISPFQSLVTWISKISYALYLCHIPVIILLNQYVLGVVWNDPATKHDYHMPIYFGTAFALASLVYVAWEQPWMRLRDRVTTQ
jgi:peptidoglycan/LPS O-acetylase OafA/YrhL